MASLRRSLIVRLVTLAVVAVLLGTYVSAGLGVAIFLIGTLLFLINARYRRCPSCQRVNPRRASLCSHCQRPISEP